MPTRVPPFQPLTCKTVGAAGLSGAGVGVKAAYTCPAQRQAVVSCANVGNFAGAPTVQLRVTVGAVTLVLSTFTAEKFFPGPVYLDAGDSIDLRVSAAVAGSAFDGTLTVEEYGTLE